MIFNLRRSLNTLNILERVAWKLRHPKSAGVFLCKLGRLFTSRGYETYLSGRVVNRSKGGTVSPGWSLVVVLFLYLDKKFRSTLSVFTQLYDIGGKFNENIKLIWNSTLFLNLYPYGFTDRSGKFH